MPLIVEALDLEPKPFALAQALADRCQVALIWLGNRDLAYLACDPVASVNALDPEPELALQPEAAPGRDVPRWIGVIPYEACRKLERVGRTRSPDPREAPQGLEPEWLRYAAVVEMGRGVRVVGDDPKRVRELGRLLRRPPRPSDVSLSFDEPPEPVERHMDRIRTALQRISAGDLYQVNLARRYRLSAQGTPWDLLRAFSARGILPFSVGLRWPNYDVVATSPELFLALSPNGQVTTAPIKGTRPRSPDPREDAELARELDQDPKERAELAMVLDVERNDLGRIARVGSVQLAEPPHLESHPTVHHRAATLSAALRAGVTRQELLSVMLPSGSVTGAPKTAAMELIAELEAYRRGLYTGAFGAIFHNGGVRLGMAIRTLTIQGSVAHYFAGGGIVADSDPAREVAETQWKARHIVEWVARGKVGP